MTRNDLAAKFKDYYKTGVGAEVGVYWGVFAKRILMNYPGKLLAVDPYKDYCAEIPMEGAMEEARKRIGSRNSEFVKKDSLKAAKDVKDRSLDFVYIDADHSYKAVKDDIKAWFPKVRKGGILSGHDYCEQTQGSEVYGVIKAVDEFCKKNKLELHLTEEEDSPSWWVVK